MLELEKVVGSTVNNYSARADSFADWAFGPQEANAREAQAKFLSHLGRGGGGGAPRRVLDAGCGPGRDLLAFAKSVSPPCLPVGFDACPKFCKTARQKTNCTVVEGDLCSIANSFQEATFDGIFSLATLFHIPRSTLPNVLKQLVALLKPSGVLLTSFPADKDHDGLMSDGRWNNSLPLKMHTEFLTSSGLEIVECFSNRLYNGNWGVIISKKS